MDFQGEKKRPIKVGSVKTVDIQTGRVVEERHNSFTMLPCPPDVCQECAVDHPHDQPHNQQSLYYQYQFYGKQGRWPTWKDAVSHCAEPVRAAWEAELRRRGAWSEPEGGHAGR